MNWIKRLWWSAILLAILIAGAIVWSWEPDRQLGELVARWAPEPSRFIELDGMQVHIRDTGPRNDPTPIVLLHGMSSSLHSFEGWQGAPQSLYSDHFVHDAPLQGPIGFKVEAAPLHPGMASILMGGHGQRLMTRFQQYPHTQMMLSLMRDGFHPESVGGKVRMMADGSAEFTKKLGMELDLTARGMGVRSNRYSMLVKNGVVTQLNVEAPGVFENSTAEKLLSQI